MSDAKLPPRKGPKMATSIASPSRRKSAKQELLDVFAEAMDSAEKTMTAREFRKAAKKASDVLDRALAKRKPRSASA